jgi:hypothetical protein
MFGATARKTVTAGIGILGAATTLFFLVKYHRFINVALEAMGRTLLFSVVLVWSSLAGTYLYFGGQLSMLVDRTTIASDLAFYSLVVGFCLAPLAIYRAVERAIKQAKKEKARAAPSPQDAPSEQKTEEQSWARQGLDRVAGAAGHIPRLMGAVTTKPAAMARRARDVVAPKELPEKLGKQVRYIAISPAALLVFVATVSHLGQTYAIVFLTLALIVAIWARNHTVTSRLLLASIFGVAFGLAHGLHISEVAPSARVHLISQGDIVHGTVLMNTFSGAILIKPDKQLALVPWTLIRTVEIAPGPSLSSRMAKLQVHSTRAAQFLRDSTAALVAKTK